MIEMPCPTTLAAPWSPTNNARSSPNIIKRSGHRMARNDPPLDATIRVVTPENIAFEYRLAGSFRRLPAFLLDFCIGAAIFIGLAIAIGSTVSIASGALTVAILFLLHFVIWWFYGVLFETFMN